MTIIYVDACPTASAWWESDDNNEIHPYNTPLPVNQAEYRAILDGMTTTNGRYGRIDLVIRSDSQLAIRQILGISKVKSPKLRNLYNLVKSIRHEFMSVTFEWIPREENPAGWMLEKLKARRKNGSI